MKWMLTGYYQEAPVIIQLSPEGEVNSQGYSELREPIRTRENCYSLVWYTYILKVYGFLHVTAVGIILGLNGLAGIL